MASNSRKNQINDHAAIRKWNGWGYKDTKFQYNEKDGVFEVTGNRYKISGHQLPLLKDWFLKIIDASLDRKSLSQPEMPVSRIPTPIINQEFLNDLKNTQISYSDEPHDRLFRGHGN